MNYTKAFSYVFDDREWVSKILIAGLISLIPVVGWLYLGGWAIEIIRRVRAGRTDILPRTHFGEFVSTGLKYAVISLVFSIPIYVLNIAGKINGAIIEDSESTAVMLIAGGAGCFIALVTVAISFAIDMMMTAGEITLAETGKLAPSLNIGDAFRSVKANFKLYAINFLLSIVVALIGAVGVIFCGVGVIFTFPYATAVAAHLLGQIWLNRKEVVSTQPKVRKVAPVNSDVVEKPYNSEQPVAEPFIPRVVDEVAERTEVATEEAVRNNAEEIVASADETVDGIVVETPSVIEMPAPASTADDRKTEETSETSDSDDVIPPFA